MPPDELITVETIVTAFIVGTIGICLGGLGFESLSDEERR